MTPLRILIAGIGNIFLGDDAFGVEVAQKLLQRQWPEGVRVVDFGIRGLDLTYALLEGCDVAILIDAVPRGHAPGTLYVIEPDTSAMASPSPDDMMAGDLLIETHGMDPVKVLRLVTVLGGHLQRILLVGCEPTPPHSEDDMEMTLSAPVQSAIEEAVILVESLVAKIRSGEYEPVAMPDDAPFLDQTPFVSEGDVEHGNPNATI